MALFRLPRGKWNVEHDVEDRKQNVEDLKDLERLVSELMKNRANRDKVRDQMERLGLPFSEDPLQQMATVLSALHSVEK